MKDMPRAGEIFCIFRMEPKRFLGTCLFPCFRPFVRHHEPVDFKSLPRVAAISFILRVYIRPSAHTFSIQGDPRFKLQAVGVQERVLWVTKRLLSSIYELVFRRAM